MGFDWHKSSQLQWNSMSQQWNQNSEEMWESGSRKTIIPLFSKYINPASGMILDAGCGDGYGTMMLGKLGFHVMGMDLSEEMVTKAKERITPDINIEFHQGDIISMPFGPEAFSGILSINCLEWVQSPLAALCELKRVLQKDGILCLGVLGPTAAPRQHSYKRLYGEKVVCNTMMPWEFARLAEENGFAILEGQGVYKRGVDEKLLGSLSEELKQALTFLWIFIMQKK
ncbi:MAG TPA: class I SAM-dependent methyltransferase [Bacillota bacterium]|nr:class I SAM-dependent methyltransferase [Bacillota bacterium]